MYDWHPDTIRKLFKHLSITDLPESKPDRTCTICERQYQATAISTTMTPWTQLAPPLTEEPIRLPCGHVFGERCIQLRAFPPPHGRNQNSCPMCRDPIFVLSEAQERQYEIELQEMEDEGRDPDQYTLVDFLCTWIEGEEILEEGGNEVEEEQGEEEEEFAETREGEASRRA